ncbi:MAG: hypothetical protein ACMUIU_17150 [bacterium]
MKRVIFLSMILTLLSLPATIPVFAQPVIYDGTITTLDINGNILPLEGVTVKIRNQTEIVSTVTNQDGYYRIFIELGLYPRLEATKFGYDDYNRDVSGAGGTYNFRMNLTWINYSGIVRNELVIPISGAVVTLHGDKTDLNYTTGESGYYKFSILQLDLGSSPMLTAEYPGYHDWGNPVSLDGGTYDIGMSKIITLIVYKGTVKDKKSGALLSNVHIKIQCSSKSFTDTTGADGKYEILVLQEEVGSAPSLRATKSGYYSFSRGVSVSGEVVDILLEKIEADFYGTVTDGKGDPLSDVHVIIQAESQSFSDYTDTEGYYFIHTLNIINNPRLIATKAEYQSVAKENISKDGGEYSFSMKVNRFSGTVTDINDHPIEGVKISIQDEGGIIIPDGIEMSDITDTNGYYEILILPIDLGDTLLINAEKECFFNYKRPINLSDKIHDFQMSSDYVYILKTLPENNNINGFVMDTPYGCGYHIDSMNTSGFNYILLAYLDENILADDEGKIAVSGYFRQDDSLGGILLEEGRHFSIYILDSDATTIIQEQKILLSDDGTDWIFKGFYIEGLSAGESYKIGFGRKNIDSENNNITAEWSEVRFADSAKGNLKINGLVFHGTIEGYCEIINKLDCYIPLGPPYNEIYIDIYDAETDEKIHSEKTQNPFLYTYDGWEREKNLRIDVKWRQLKTIESFRKASKTLRLTGNEVVRFYLQPENRMVWNRGCVFHAPDLPEYLKPTISTQDQRDDWIVKIPIYNEPKAKLKCYGDISVNVKSATYTPVIEDVLFKYTYFLWISTSFHSDFEWIPDQDVNEDDIEIYLDYFKNHTINGVVRDCVIYARVCDYPGEPGKNYFRWGTEAGNHFSSVNIIRTGPTPSELTVNLIADGLNILNTGFDGACLILTLLKYESPWLIAADIGLNILWEIYEQIDISHMTNSDDNIITNGISEAMVEWRNFSESDGHDYYHKYWQVDLSTGEEITDLVRNSAVISYGDWIIEDLLHAPNKRQLLEIYAVYRILGENIEYNGRYYNSIQFQTPSVYLELDLNEIPEAVTAYQDCDAEGTEYRLEEGEYTATRLNEIGILEDKISSIKVPSDFMVTLFKNDNFDDSDGIKEIYKDTYFCYTDTDWDQAISSLIVKRKASAYETGILGTCLDNDDNPLENVTVNLLVDGEIYGTTQTDSDGNFKISIGEDIIAKQQAATLEISHDGNDTEQIQTTIIPNHLKYEMITYKPPPTVSVEMNLSRGWSMISLPVIPLDDASAISVLFPEAIVVYNYDSEIGYVRIQKSETLQVGNGYWILLDQDQNYLLTGYAINSYKKPISSDGWKMIGGCTSSAKPEIAGGDIIVIYEYNPGYGYNRVLVGNNLESGKGYWILIKNIDDKTELKVS